MSAPSSIDELPDLATPKEVAGVLRVDVDRVRRACTDGRMPHLRFGRRIMIPREPLREHLYSSAWAAVSSGSDLDAPTEPAGQAAESRRVTTLDNRRRGGRRVDDTG